MLDNDDVLARIRVPTLVVHGAHDRIVLEERGRAHRARSDGARLLLYDGLGHAPHYEATDRFHADLAAFVRRVAGRR